MKLSFTLVLSACSSLTSALHARAASCTGNANNCLRAIRGAPSGEAQSFCSSALGRVPATSTYTSSYITTVTVTQTAIATVYVTTVTGTVTALTTVAPPVKLKRAKATTNLASSISSQCSSNTASVSNACNCYLSGSPTSTVGVTTTVSSTVTATATATNTITSTVDIAVTTTATTTTSPPPLASPTCPACPANPSSDGTLYCHVTGVTQDYCFYTLCVPSPCCGEGDYNAVNGDCQLFAFS